MDHSRTNANEIAPWIIILSANRYYRHTISLDDTYHKNTNNDNQTAGVHVNQRVNNHLALQRLRLTRSCVYYHYLCLYFRFLTHVSVKFNFCLEFTSHLPDVSLFKIS